MASPSSSARGSQRSVLSRSQTWLSRLPLRSAVLLSTTMACSEPPALSVGDDFRDSGAEPDAAASCDETQVGIPCSCDRGAQGTLECVAAGALVCDCIPPDGGPAVKSKCVPGTYAGRQEGTYKGGIPGFVTLVAIDIGAPMTFTLEQEGEEFAPVKNGCVHVPAPEGASFEYQSVTAIEGEVDCTTGTLKGVMRAFYMLDLGGGPQRVFFKGSMNGTYNPQTHSFEGGTWEGHEPPNLLPGDVPGGGGAWAATLVEEGAISEPTDCLGVEFPEERFPDTP
jgi:hypothetical protein